MNRSRTTNESPHQCHLRAGRWSESLACYAITRCIQGRRAIVAEEQAARVVISTLQFQRKQGKLRLLAFCIMPDRYHSLFFSASTESRSDVMRCASSFMAAEIKKLNGQQGNIWQKGFYDHRCRGADDIEDRLTYIEHNPVRAGYVDRPSAWPYASAHSRWATTLDREWYNRVR